MLLFVNLHPVDRSHVSVVQALLSLHSFPEPAKQIPPEHVSPVVQALPSLQVNVLFALTQPVEVLHESFVQALPSSQVKVAPAAQLPPEQTSGVVHALLSLHALELFVNLHPVVASQLSLVHALLSPHALTEPAWQLPPLHASLSVQALPSLHPLALLV